MLKAWGIQKAYGDLPVLRGIDLDLYPGELVALIGSSGAGKTTLLQILGTLDRADAGEAYLDDHNLGKLSRSERARFRNTYLGFIFQFHHLMAEFNALENVCLPALIQGQSFSKCQGRARELLDELGMGHRLTHRPAELSGGEQQRVAVARALMNQPRLILADEPTGNLDSANRRSLLELFRYLARSRGVSFLVATHNEDFAAGADRSFYIQDGYIVQPQPTAADEHPAP
jgi:lipoprotein-releasing system ATP-binding protein